MTNDELITALEDELLFARVAVRANGKICGIDSVSLVSKADDPIFANLFQTKEALELADAAENGGLVVICGND